jgi:uncharacterized protein GlcG (DUF336 family)
MTSSKSWPRLTPGDFVPNLAIQASTSSTLTQRLVKAMLQLGRQRLAIAFVLIRPRHGRHDGNTIVPHLQHGIRVRGLVVRVGVAGEGVRRRQRVAVLPVSHVGQPEGFLGGHLVDGALEARERVADAALVVVDLDGVRQALLRGNGAPIHTLDNAFYKAYSAASLTLVRQEDSAKAVADQLSKNPPTTVPQTPLPSVTYAVGGLTIMAGGVAKGARGHRPPNHGSQGAVPVAWGVIVLSAAVRVPDGIATYDCCAPESSLRIWTVSSAP